MVAANIMTTWTWLSSPLVSKPPVHLQQIVWMNKLYHNLPLSYLRNLQGMSFDISFPLFCINFPTFEILHIFILVKDPSSNILLLFSQKGHDITRTYQAQHHHPDSQCSTQHTQGISRPFL